MREIYDKWRVYQYYVIIGVISFVALFFLPMIGSELIIGWNVPSSWAGWVVYVVTKLMVAVINILIFHCFVLQAKVNIKDDERYKEACAILEMYLDDNKHVPRSPEEYIKEIYNKKATFIFITSILSAFSLTQAILSFDWMTMLTYLFTILMGVIFGVMQMNETETYWTEEFYLYAKKIEAERKETTEDDSNRRQGTEESGGTGSVEQESN